MMEKIKDVEHFKKMKLFRALAKKSILRNSDESYLELIIQPFDFSGAEFNPTLIEYTSDDIIGKTIKEFLDWLREKCEEEGYTLEGVLEADFSVVQDYYLLEKMFDETKETLVSDPSKIYKDDYFYELENELYDEEPYFTSFEDTKQFLKEKYSQFNID